MADIKDIDKEIAALEKKEKVMQRLAELEQENVQSAKKIADSVSNTVSSYTKISTESTTLAGQFTRMMLSSEGIGDAWSKVTKTIGETAKSLNNLLSFTNILSSLMDTIVTKTLEFLTAQDQMASNFEKAVGGAAKLKGEIISIYSGNALYAASLEEVGQAYIELKRGMTDFEDLSVKERLTVGNAVVQLTKLGVSTSDLVRIQATLHKSMGMSVTQVAGLEKQLYGTAIAMGLPPQKMIKDFADAAPKLAGYGKNMVNVFVDLQSAAKRTGIEMNTLLDISGKFDTFDSAAKAVGELNAVLGGDYFDTQKLMSMNDAERVQYLQQQLQLSGQSLDSMDRFQQKQIAQSLGLKDVAQLQALYNNETGKTGNKLTEQEKSQQLMNKATQSAVTLTDRLNRMWEEFGLIFGPMLEPIIPVIKDLALEVGGFIKELTVWWKKIEGTEKLKKLWTDLKDIISTTWETYIKPYVNKFLGFFGTSTDSLYAAMQGGVSSFTKEYEKIKKSFLDLPKTIETMFPNFNKVIKFLTDMWGNADGTTKKIVGFGAAFVTVKGVLSGLGGLFGSDDDEQTEKNKKMSDSLGEGGITGGIRAVGQTISSFSAVFKDFGLAIAGIGVGIGAAALGVSKLVDSFASLDKEQIKTITDSIQDIFVKLGIGGAVGAATGAGLSGLVSWITGEGQKVRDFFVGFAWAAAAAGIGVGVAAFGIGSVIDKFTAFAQTTGGLNAFKEVMDQIEQTLGRLSEKIGLKSGIGIGNALDNLADVFEELGNASEKGLPFFEAFVNVNEEDVTKMQKAFRKGVTENMIPAFNDIRSYSGDTTALLDKFNIQFNSFEEILGKIADKDLDNIVKIREEIQKISGEQTKFATVVNGLSSVAQILTSGMGQGLAQGVEALNKALNSFTPERLEVLEKIKSYSDADIQKLKEANTVTLDAAPGSPIDILAKALTLKDGVEIVINMNSQEVGRIMMEDPQTAAMFSDGMIPGKARGRAR